MMIEAVDRIEGGTSGGPAVDLSGRLVAVISHSVEVKTGEKCSGFLPITGLALPALDLTQGHPGAA